MLIKTPEKSILKTSDITDESIYLQRRQLVKSMGFLGAGALLGSAISTKANAGFFDSKDPDIALSLIHI